MDKFRWRWTSVYKHRCTCCSRPCPPNRRWIVDQHAIGPEGGHESSWELGRFDTHAAALAVAIAAR